MSKIRFEFHDFDLLVEPGLVKLLRSTAGTRSDDEEARANTFQLPVVLDLERVESLVMQTADEARDRCDASRDEDWVRTPLEEVQQQGQALFSQLLQGGSVLLHHYIRSFLTHEAGAMGLNQRTRLRLRLSPQPAGKPQLENVPWEMLHASRNVIGRFLALNASVVRTPTTRVDPAPPVTVEPPLKMLLVADSPYAPEQERLVEQEAHIHEALARVEREGRILVQRLTVRPEDASTLAAIQRTLEEETIHILHFMGHGYHDDQQEEPVGYLEMTRHGQPYDFTGQEVAQYLRSGVQRGLRLVVLNACEGARQSSQRKDRPRLRYTSVAQALLDIGIPAVLAMQYEISNPAAERLAEAFYRRLGQTWSIDEATRYARQHLLHTITGTLEWLTPVLYLTTASEPIRLAATVPQRSLVVPARFDAYIKEKTDRFVGRHHVFTAIDAFLERNPNGYFEIEGDPGVGKSAILAEFVRRTGAVVHFNIRAQSINSYRDFLESLYSQLVDRYGLPDNGIPEDAYDSGKFLDRLIQDAGAQLELGERLLIAVDALDEVDHPTSQPDSQQNIFYFPQVLPKGVYFVLTRRQTPITLSAHVPTYLLDLMAKKYEVLSAEDIQTYIWREVEGSEALRSWIANQEKPLNNEEFVTKLSDLSCFNFMYLRHVLPAIRDGDYRDLAIEDLPAGLTNYYELHWKRMGMMTRPRPRKKIKIIYLLTVIKRPTSAKLLAKFASESALDVIDILEEWDEFLHEEPVEKETRYSVYHASFRDFLYRQDIIQAAEVDLKEITKQAGMYFYQHLYQP